MSGSPLLRTETITDAAIAGVNHFDPIRLIAALLVLFAHAFHLPGRGGEEPIGRWFLSVDASLVGVAMFFFISGFLVTRSWTMRGSFVDFAVARALRIMPALCVALLVTVFVIGPLFTSLSVGGYFADPLTWKYLGLNAILRPQYLLPGVFEANPLPGVNGSLWTIPLEATCYAIVGAIGWALLIGRSHAALASGIADARRSPSLPSSTSLPSSSASLASAPARMVVIAFLAIAAVALAAKIALTSPTYLGLALEFALGSIAYRYRHRIPLNPVAAVVLLLIAAATARVALPFPVDGYRITLGTLLLAFAGPYALLTFALHRAFAGRATWVHRHDYSYGTYLYGFPVQQAAIAMGIREPVILLAVAVTVTLALAAASWHGVERHALALKRRRTPDQETRGPPR